MEDYKANSFMFHLFNKINYLFNTKQQKYKDKINDVLTFLINILLIVILRYLIVSTGIAKPNVPNIVGIEHTETYEDISLDQDDFEAQSVLILGRGNSAFETADHIIGNTNVIHMISRSRVRLAWETHYVGDLRLVLKEIMFCVDFIYMIFLIGGANQGCAKTHSCLGKRHIFEQALYF